MNEGVEFRLHPGAADDLTEIWEYIATDSPIVAQPGRCYYIALEGW
jgi:hypothetical protein